MIYNYLVFFILIHVSTNTSYTPHIANVLFNHLILI